jgi:tartrate/fumarate subfamily iron-sulfur-dependent hydro-lyase alpha chain
MCHPLTRENPGNNTGSYIPSVEIKFDSGIDYMEVTFVPKGGGAEIFGTFYRMMFPGDGKQGIMKFILECAGESTYAGGTCPPNILGIGIGGTADICMKIAKEAAVLRPIGSRHPEPEIAQMEIDLLEAINMLNRGPMGGGGITTLFDAHIEYAATHTAALAVGFSSQCALAKRATGKLGKDGQIQYADFPSQIHHGKVGKGV